MFVCLIFISRIVIESEVIVSTSTFVDMEAEDGHHMNTFDNDVEEENICEE